MIKIDAPKNCLDLCGTGGDQLNTLNISNVAENIDEIKNEKNNFINSIFTSLHNIVNNPTIINTNSNNNNQTSTDSVDVAVFSSLRVDIVFQ